MCVPQKCTEYWPEDSVVCEGIEITVKQVIQADDYSLRIFTVKVCLFYCVQREKLICAKWYKEIDLYLYVLFTKLANPIQYISIK